ncbi:SASB hydrolase, partial [Amia calva]|nr:SASB hydrolase [Amia calva]
GPLTSIKNGTLEGRYGTVKGTEKIVYEYLAVPFAKPPVGPLRFASPEPPQPWEGTKDASKQPPQCIQDLTFVETLKDEVSLHYTIQPVSEDCLYLNIYTPVKPSTEKKIPVMVWIHGGGFQIGAASWYDGSALAAYEDVVVVIIQYRLGVLGFLSTGDEHARGNFGFLDQIAALQWVKENIKSFGGDPESVTIFGESAGGISVSALVVSPLASGLFHKAISQSGVATLMFPQDPMTVARKVANISECDDSSSEQIVKCLMQKTERDILDIANKMKMSVFLMGVQDGKFLPQPIRQMFQDKEFNKVPVLLGVTNHECGWLLAKVDICAPWLGQGHGERASIDSPEYRIPTRGEGAKDLIVKEYLGQTEDPEDIRDLFTEMLGDLFMAIPTVQVANYHKDAGVPVYLYEFQHRLSLHGDKRPNFVKADHGDDIPFVFGSCFWNGDIKFEGVFTEEEIKLCRTVMGYWANFARNG